MIVVIGGMIRSGSTFTFNIVRELLARQGSVEIAAANTIAHSILAQSNEQSFILKTHEPDNNVINLIKNGIVPCICTIRNPEDAVASWMNTFGFSLEHGIISLKTWYSWYSEVVNKVLTINYQIIELQPRIAIKLIIEFLGMESNEELIDMLEKKYNRLSLKEKYDVLTNNESTVDIGFSYYDMETFFHRRHISLSQTKLTPSQIEQIKSELKEYLNLHR